MSAQRNQYTSQQKVPILRRHLLNGVTVSDLGGEGVLHPIRPSPCCFCIDTCLCFHKIQKADHDRNHRPHRGGTRIRAPGLYSGQAPHLTARMRPDRRAL